MRAMAMAQIFNNYIPNTSTIEAQVQTERENLGTFGTAAGRGLESSCYYRGK